MMERFLVLCAIVTLVCSQSCISEDGEAVDWFVVLKAPRENGGYGYYDSKMDKEGSTTWKVTEGASFITADNSVYQTLKQINDMSLSRIAWNDGPASSSSYAHSKAVIAWSVTNSKGFEIDHSLPFFPDFDEHKVGLVNGESSNRYGQHVFCMSHSVDDLNEIAKKTINIKGFIYQHWLNDEDSASPKGLQDLFNSASKEAEKSLLKNPFSYYDFTLGSKSVKAIFKSNAPEASIFGDSPYGEGMTAMLSSGLLVESWQGDKTSYCPASGNSVVYVKRVTLDSENPISWKRTQDHSKWAISTADGLHWSCFGGMNRQKSQWNRGGQFFCVDSKNLHQAMKAVINQQDSCA